MTTFRILIPVRLASTRLPNKALADLHGAPMIVRVWQRAVLSDAMSVHVVTDSEEIRSVIEAQGGDVILSEADHASGTDRLAEVVARMPWADDEIVVNLQGDEPLMPVACIQQVAAALHGHAPAQMATLYETIADVESYQSPHVVKVMVDTNGRALCFSRAPIPYGRTVPWPQGCAKRHVGLYAYRAKALRLWPELPISEIEAVESLEQWRALSHGWQMMCERAVESIPAGIDTPEDLERVRQWMAGH